MPAIERNCLSAIGNISTRTMKVRQMIATPKLPVTLNSQFKQVEDRPHEPFEPAPVDRLGDAGRCRRSRSGRAGLFLGAGEQARFAGHRLAGGEDRRLAGDNRPGRRRAGSSGSWPRSADRPSGTSAVSQYLSVKPSQPPRLSKCYAGGAGFVERCPSRCRNRPCRRRSRIGPTCIVQLDRIDGLGRRGWRGRRLRTATAPAPPFATRWRTVNR